MAGKITGFIREFILSFSIILTIVGIFVLFVGVTGTLEDHPMNFLNLSEETLNWGIYFLIIGFIIFATGIWYLYKYLKNRKFILDELKTNKRSELIKKHSELKITVKHMPSKYRRMLSEKEEELNIK